MHELGLDMMRQRLRRENPNATVDVIEELLRRWLGDRPFDTPDVRVRQD